MPLTTEQARLVTHSYSCIAAAPRSYAERFYHRLLLDHPFARALFPDDITHQIVAFEQTIDVLVGHVSDLGRLHPTLSDLAKRHVKYGVRAHHYAAIGIVLIDTFQDVLGGGFTPEIREAWEAVYADTAGAMIAAAYRGGDPSLSP